MRANKHGWKLLTADQPEAEEFTRSGATILRYRVNTVNSGIQDDSTWAVERWDDQEFAIRRAKFLCNQGYQVDVLQELAFCVRTT